MIPNKSILGDITFVNFKSLNLKLVYIFICFEFFIIIICFTFKVNELFLPALHMHAFRTVYDDTCNNVLSVYMTAQLVNKTSNIKDT